MKNTAGLLSVEESARACGVSDETIRRRLRAKRLPGAVREPGSTGAWRIPLQDLLACGLQPKLGGGEGQVTGAEVVRLKDALDSAERLLSERQARIDELVAHVADLRAVLDMRDGRASGRAT